MESTAHGKKIYYTMGEVAEMFDVNPSLIRFWEQKFDILKPHKNKKGNRLFTPEDVDNLKLIYHLVKEKGMTLSGAQKRLKENREGLERNLEVIEKLQGIRALLLEIRQELKHNDSDAEEIVIESPIVSEETETVAIIFQEEPLMHRDPVIGFSASIPALESSRSAEELPGTAPKSAPAADMRGEPNPGEANAAQQKPETEAGQPEGAVAKPESEMETAKSDPEAAARPRIIEQTLF